MELGLRANNEEVLLLNGLAVWYLGFVDGYNWILILILAMRLNW